MIHARTGSRWLTRFFVALMVMMSSPVRGVDSVLVPLEDARLSLHLLSALEALEEGRYRDGVESLQVVANAEPTVLVQVPSELPRDFSALKKAFEMLVSPDDGDVAVRPTGRRFLPAVTMVQLVLSWMPPAAVEVYRELHSEQAAELLAQYETEGDLKYLRRAARLFLVTKEGQRAAELLGDELFEGGLYRQAVRSWRWVLLASSSVATPSNTLREKMLYALRLLGEEAAYKYESTRWLALASPESRAEVEALLRKVEATPMVSREGSPADVGRGRWGGELRDTPPPSLKSAEFKKSWASDLWSRKGLPPQGISPSPRGRRRFYHSVMAGDYPFVPLVDASDVYVSGVFQLYRIAGQPDRGSITHDYRKPSPPALSGDLPSYVERSESAVFSTTIWQRPTHASARMLGLPESFPERVLVTHYVNDRVRASQFMSYDITVEIPIRALVAFDAETREVLWKTGKRRASRWLARGARDPKRELSYTSPAIVRDGVVIAAGWIQRGFVDTLVRAHDLRSGELVWETFLSGAQLELTLFGEMAREPFACAVAERDGVAYFCTQFGVVAAVECQSGVVQWSATYDTIPMEVTRSRIAPKRDIVWGRNALLVSDHRLFVMPRDSEYLFAFDNGTGPEGERSMGRMLWRYHNGDGRLRDFLGAYDGRLYFTGSDGVGVLDVRGLEGAVHHEVEASRLTYESFGQLRLGPGVLTAEGVAYTDEAGINLYRRPRTAQESGSLTQLVFDPSAEPGRLSLEEGLLFRTTRHLLSAYQPVIERPTESSTRPSTRPSTRQPDN